MTDRKHTPKDAALEHVAAALKNIRSAQEVRFRDPELKATLKTVENLLTQSRSKGDARTHLEYDNLANGATLSCPANANLLMRAGKRTGKLWLFRYRDADGNEKELRLGTYPEVTVAQARVKAEELRAKKAAGESLVDKRSALTMAGLCELYIEHYALGVDTKGNRIKRSGDMDARMLRKNIIPHFGDIPAVEFSPDQVDDAVLNLSRTGATREAGKLHALLSVMFNVATGNSNKMPLGSNRWLPRDHRNPASLTSRPQHTTQSFSPDAEQLRAFIAGTDDVAFGRALMLQLLTMTRVSESAQAAWSEFDLDNAVWHLPAERSKNGHGYTIQLSAQAVELLREQEQTRTSDFLFPAPRDPSRPTALNNLVRTASRIRTDAGLPAGFTTHSLRHAGLTWLAENLCPIEVRNALTNHRTRAQDSMVDHGYTKNADYSDHCKDWASRWADYIDELRGVGQSNIVKMPLGQIKPL